MTVQQQTSFNVYTGNGVTTVFPYQFKILAAGDLTVYVDGVLKLLNVDYTLSGVGNNGGGNVTFISGAPGNGLAVSNIRAMRRERLTDYQQQGDFLTGTVNPDFDRAVMLIQDFDAQLGRSVRLPADEVATLPTLPSKATRIGKYFTFDALGNPFVSVGTGNDTALRTDLASTVAANDGSLLVGFRRTEAGSLARSIALKLREQPSVADFNALGAGLADEAGALSNASAGAPGKVIWLPKGTYLVTSAWNLSAGTTYEGEGPGTIIKMQSSQLSATDLAGITFKNLKVINNGITGASLIFIRCDDLTFENVTFDNTLGATNPNGTTAIWLKGCDNVVVRRCKFLNCAQGVYGGDDGAGRASGTVSVQRCHFEHTILSQDAFPTAIYQFRCKHMIVDVCTFKNIFPGGAHASPRGYCLFEGDGIGESVTTTVRDCVAINTATVGETGPNVFCQVAQSKRATVSGCWYDAGGEPGEFFEGGGTSKTVLFNNDILSSYVLCQPLDGATLCGELHVLSNRWRLSTQGLAACRLGGPNGGFNYATFEDNSIDGSSGGGVFVSDVRKYAKVLNNTFLDCNLADTAFNAGVNEFSVSAIAFFAARLGIVSGNHCENTVGGTGHTDFGFACDAATHAVDVRPDNIFLRMDTSPHRNTLKQGTNTWAVYPPGYIFFVGDPLTGQLPGRMVTHYFRTTISVTEAAGQTVLSVTDNTGMANGDVVSIQLDNSTSIATYHHAVINATGAGTITISGGGLPSQATAGKEVFVNRLKALGNLA